MTGTLLKFNVFTTQYKTAAAETTSQAAATESSKIHGRPRKTLKALIDTSQDDDPSPERELRALGYTLQDMFVSSSPPPSDSMERSPATAALLPLQQASIVFHGENRSTAIRRGRRYGGFRKRFLRQPWRPVLVAIPE